MFPWTSYGVILVLVLTSLTLSVNTAWAEQNSRAQYSKQETLQCVLDKGLTSKKCTEAVRGSYSDVEFPELLCRSLRFFFSVYELVGCKKDDFFMLAGIFCYKNLSCTPDVKTEVTATYPTKQLSNTNPSMQLSTTNSTKEAEHSSTLKPAPATESSPDKPNDLTGNAACVVEGMLSSTKCKAILKIQLKKNSNLASVCEWLKSHRMEVYNCSLSDKDKLGKVVCDNMTVTCPLEPEVSSPGQLVNAIIEDFSESCKETVQFMIDDFVKDKNKTCETIDDDLSVLCSDEEISKLRDAVCNDDKKP